MSPPSPELRRLEADLGSILEAFDRCLRRGTPFEDELRSIEAARLLAGVTPGDGVGRDQRHWGPRDQKVLAGLDRRCRQAEEAGADSMEVAPEDLRWALNWLMDLAHHAEPGPEGGEDGGR